MNDKTAVYVLLGIIMILAVYATAACAEKYYENCDAKFADDVTTREVCYLRCDERFDP